jgi:hypothetical protein
MPLEFVPPTPAEVREAIEKMKRDIADWRERERQRRRQSQHCPSCTCFVPLPE